MVVFINFIIPIISYGFIYNIDVESSPSFALCVGKAYLNFFTSEYNYCASYENIFARYGCRVWSLIIFILMTNVFDVYFIFLCSKLLKEQTEASKQMISEKDYISRRR